MANISEWILRVSDQFKDPLERFVGAAGKAEVAGKKLINVVDDIGGKYLKFNQMTLAVQNVEQGFSSLTGGAMKLEQGMAELKAMTGVGAGELERIEQSAMRMAETFGSDAVGNVENFTKILSRLGPEIARNPEALERMGNMVSTMGVTMKRDYAGAMDALTTSMLQYNVSMDNPIKATETMVTMMDMVSKGALLGASDVAQSSAALRIAGTNAYAANVKFSELNAAFQVMAQGGKYASEAGTGLRNVISKLSQGRFLPKRTLEELVKSGVDIGRLTNKSLSLGDRLRELKKAAGDTALMFEFFGEENSVAGITMLNNIDKMDKWTKSIQGGRGATEEMARTMMATSQGKADRMMARFENFRIGLGKHIMGVAPYVGVLSASLLTLTQVQPAFMMLGNGLRWVRTGLISGIKSMGAWIGMAGRWVVQTTLMGARAAWTGLQLLWGAAMGFGPWVAGLLSATLAQWGLNVAIYASPVGWFMAALLALAAVIGVVIYYWDEIKEALVRFGNWLFDNFKYFNPMYWMIEGIELLFPGFKKWLSKVWDDIVAWFKQAWDWIVGWYNKIVGKISGGELNLGVNFKGVDDVLGGGVDAKKLGLGDQETNITKVNAGGSKPTNVTVHIGKFQDKIEIHSTNIKEGVDDLQKRLEEMLLRVANSYNVQGVQ